MPNLDNLFIYKIADFQDKVRKGIVSDNKGKAYLIIRGTLNSNYTVHIDRRIVSSHGTVVSFVYLMKEYGAENIEIGYELKPTGLPDLTTYRTMKIKEAERRKKYGK